MKSIIKHRIYIYLLNCNFNRKFNFLRKEDFHFLLPHFSFHEMT